MHFTRNAMLLMTAVTTAAAFPLEEFTVQLGTRSVIFDTSCQAKLPGATKKENTYEKRLKAAFADVIKMIKATRESKDGKGNGFTESTAFSRYFNAGDKQTVKDMMEVVDNIVNKAGDDITISCGSKADKACGPSVLAATNPIPGESTMVFCDRFFSSATSTKTKNDLRSKKFDASRSGWCQTGKPFSFFEVAALTVFHEMTHLDVVGERAGLVDRPDIDPATGAAFQSAGTVDVYAVGTEKDMERYEGTEPQGAAVKLKQLWDANKASPTTAYKPIVELIHNAESYAAAALEFYYLSQCKWESLGVKLTSSTLGSPKE